ncbi:MAG: HAMP domain-containing sensor histidine kinase [Acidobacteriota bacterium]
MRRARGLLVFLLLALLGVGVVADRALRTQDEAALTLAAAEVRDTARLEAFSVRAHLARLETSAAAGSAAPPVVAHRVRSPPSRARPRPSEGYQARHPSRLTSLLSSTEATSNSLPESLVAAVASGALSQPRRRQVLAKRLLSGELPVHPADLPYLARLVGAEADPRLAPLQALLESAPATTSLPELPAFQRTVTDDLLVGWARSGDELVHYRVPWEHLAAVAAIEGALVTRAGAETTRAETVRVDVPDLPELMLEHHSTTASPTSSLLTRIVTWSSLGLLGLAGWLLTRALDRQAAALRRERSFLAAVTHELRTPLASVRVLGETLAEGRGNAREYGGLIADESNRLDALVDRVLATTRLDEAPQFVPTSPLELLTTVLEVVRPRAGRLSVVLDTRLPTELPQARWDADAVRRAVHGLLDNALRHGCSQGGRIELTAQRSDDAIVVSVNDDGPGIARRDRERLFGRFERAGSTAGTGLGLHLIEQVARLHGGRVELDVPDDQGCHFSLWLPLHPPASDEAGGS